MTKRIIWPVISDSLQLRGPVSLSIAKTLHWTASSCLICTWWEVHVDQTYWPWLIAFTQLFQKCFIHALHPWTPIQSSFIHTALCTLHQNTIQLILNLIWAKMIPEKKAQLPLVFSLILGTPQISTTLMWNVKSIAQPYKLVLILNK